MFSDLKMVFTLVKLKIIDHMVKEHLIEMMVVHMKVNGDKENLMDKELLIIQMENFMKEILIMVKEMVMEYIEQEIMNIKAIGYKVK